MIWLVFEFNTVDMTVSISPDMHTEVMAIIRQWSSKKLANIHELWILLGKLFHIAQYYPLAQFIVNCMLTTLRAYPHRAHSV